MDVSVSPVPTTAEFLRSDSFLAGEVTLPKPVGTSTRWVTRERPKIDRIACPWLVKRFIDPDASFRYVKEAEVADVARKDRAIPFDIPDTLFSHEGERCSFDAFLKVFRMDDPPLAVLARIIRGADTGRLDLAPECAGLLAVSLGMSRLRLSDHEMLRDGLLLYDALYLWARDAMQETHAWKPPRHIPQNPPRSFDRTSSEPFDSGRAWASSHSGARPVGPTGSRCSCPRGPANSEETTAPDGRYRE